MYCEVWEVIPQIYKKHIVCFMPTAEKLQTIETRLNNSENQIMDLKNKGKVKHFLWLIHTLIRN